MIGKKGLLAQSYDSYRGPTELVWNSAYRGRSHWRNGDTSQITDMVWLYRSPIPVVRGGLLFSYEDYLTSRRLKGGGGQHPVVIGPNSFEI